MKYKYIYVLAIEYLRNSELYFEEVSVDPFTGFSIFLTFELDSALLIKSDNISCTLIVFILFNLSLFGISICASG